MEEIKVTQVKNNLLFGNFSINDLYQKIYIKQQEKEKLILELLEELKLMLVDSTDIVLIGPIVKDLMDISLKNDDQLIKLATAAIRLLTANNKISLSDEDILPITKEERNQILEKLNTIENDLICIN